jgi:pyrimidine-nucleoside phosphorylase
MISGRGLGHTGGTLDKLEAIPGFRWNLSIKEMYRALKRIGCFISGSTPEIAPADRKIYALRDVTGTVDSIPLITASIMSKKLAEGVDGLVVDVKCGQGAFVKRRADAVVLARWLRKVGEKMGKVIVTVLTNMDQPIGRMVGNGLEIWETVRALKGRCEPDVLELVLTLGSRMLMIAGRADNLQQARDKLQSMLESGTAWDKFRKMADFQGGNVSVLHKKSAFVKAKYQYEVRAVQSGYVSGIDALGMGVMGIDLGVGRKKVDDRVDYDSGFEVLKKVGQAVDRKEGLVVVHSSKPLDGFSLDRARRLFRISKTHVKPAPIVLS